MKDSQIGGILITDKFNKKVDRKYIMLKSIENGDLDKLGKILKKHLGNYDMMYPTRSAMYHITLLELQFNVQCRLLGIDDQLSPSSNTNPKIKQTLSKVLSGNIGESKKSRTGFNQDTVSFIGELSIDKLLFTFTHIGIIGMNPDINKRFVAAFFVTDDQSQVNELKIKIFEYLNKKFQEDGGEVDMLDKRIGDDRAQYAISYNKETVKDIYGNPEQSDMKPIYYAVPSYHYGDEFDKFHMSICKVDDLQYSYKTKLINHDGTTNQITPAELGISYTKDFKDFKITHSN
jgi:hypothetical protein